MQEERKNMRSKKVVKLTALPNRLMPNAVE
jgi:hypothetical protein